MSFIPTSASMFAVRFGSWPTTMIRRSLIVRSSETNSSGGDDGVSGGVRQFHWKYRIGARDERCDLRLDDHGGHNNHQHDRPECHVYGRHRRLAELERDGNVRPWLHFEQQQDGDDRSVPAERGD